MRRFNFFASLSTIAGVLVLPGLTWAGASAPGQITFEPLGPTSIPTLGGFGLLVLAVALGVFALRIVRARGAGNGLASFSATGLVLGALLSAGGGMALISDAKALIPILEYKITNPSGERLNVVNSNANQYENASGVDLKVTGLVLPESCPNGASVDALPTCEIGLVLGNAGKCEVNCLELAISDRRLKTDIRKVGVAANGLPLYTFRYMGGDVQFRGVMAQDVLNHTPEAVVTLPSGYLAVNYGMLGLTMEALP